MKITEVTIRKTFTEGALRGVASVTFDNEFVVHNIKVIYANNKYFLSMPNRKRADGKYKDISHPLNNEFREKLEKAIIPAYKQAVTDSGNE